MSTSRSRTKKTSPVEATPNAATFGDSVATTLQNYSMDELAATLAAAEYEYDKRKTKEITGKVESKLDEFSKIINTQHTYLKTVHDTTATTADQQRKNSRTIENVEKYFREYCDFLGAWSIFLTLISIVLNTIVIGKLFQWW